ncbi:MAG: ROK family protein [Prevotellaceae bacterium]|jgi:predicted NBD/HSP70 family sugar kinase/mannose-6-phosphate isomerase class I|nr:ROK family protein [Prevotellaceae bacterium]
MSKEIYIGADIGGTHISAAWVEPVNGIIDGTLRTAPVDGNGSGDETVQVWKSVIRKTIAGIDDIAGIGFAMPGPFDYSRGISKIEGVQKFNSLFGLNIKEAFRSILDDNTARLCFVNDATAFALGEYYAGAARGSKRCLALTLGTGFGSTFLVDGVFRETGVGIPPNGYLYNVPFKESIADDYFSTRGFVKAWQQKTGENVDGVREIAQYAQQGNPSARAIFDGFSSGLADFLAPWIRQFNPDTVVIGGSIAKSSQLFLPGLLSELEKKNIPDTNIRISSLWDSASLTGAAMYARLQTRATTAKNSLFRKTTQFPAPEKTSPSIRGHYDIYPAFPVGTGKIHGGSDTLAARIARHKTVVIDGYEGVFWDCLIEDLNTEFLKLNKNVCWFHCDAALKQKDELYEMIKPCLGDDDSIFGKITGKNLSDWFDMDRLHKISPNPDADINILVGCGSALAGWDAPLIYVDLPKNELQFRMRAGRAFNLGFDTPADSRVMYKQAYFVDWQVLNRHKAQLLPSIGIIVDGQRPDGYLWMTGDDLREALAEMSRNFFRVRPWFEPGAWGGNWIKNNICGLNGDAENIAWSFELMTYENGLMFESDGYRLEVSFDFLMYAGYRETLGDCADRFRYDFPIRFDFLDTFDGGNLSIQCHPREEYIRREFGMPFTQDETYYILDCKDSAEVYLGFQEDIQPEKFREELVRSETQSIPVDIDRYVRKFPARKHGLFLIPNGTIHASGKDNLVLEISSAPYIFTFKMYDWLRLDLDGRPRPINIEHGMKNVDFALKGERVERELISKPRMLKRDEDEIIEHLPTHPLHFYDIHRHTFEKRITVQTQGKCHVWMLVEGKSVLLETANGLKQRFNYAETFVIPAAAQSYTLTNEDRGKVMMVKAFVR